MCKLQTPQCLITLLFYFQFSSFAEARIHAPNLQISRINKDPRLFSGTDMVQPLTQLQSSKMVNFTFQSHCALCLSFFSLQFQRAVKNPPGHKNQTRQRGHNRLKKPILSCMHLHAPLFLFFAWIMAPFYCLKL